MAYSTKTSYQLRCKGIKKIIVLIDIDRTLLFSPRGEGKGSSFLNPHLIEWLCWLQGEVKGSKTTEKIEIVFHFCTARDAKNTVELTYRDWIACGKKAEEVMTIKKIRETLKEVFEVEVQHVFNVRDLAHDAGLSFYKTCLEPVEDEMLKAEGVLAVGDPEEYEFLNRIAAEMDLKWEALLDKKGYLPGKEKRLVKSYLVHEIIGGEDKKTTLCIVIDDCKKVVLPDLETNKCLEGLRESMLVIVDQPDEAESGVGHFCSRVTAYLERAKSRGWEVAERISIQEMEPTLPMHSILSSSTESGGAETGAGAIPEAAAGAGVHK